MKRVEFETGEVGASNVVPIPIASPMAMLSSMISGNPYSYFTDEMQRQALLNIANASHMTATAMRLAMIPYQPAIDAYWAPINNNPITFRLKGIRKAVAAFNPAARDIATNMPDSLAIQFGTGAENSDDEKPGDVTAIINPARLPRTFNALGMAIQIQNYKHAKATFEEILDDAKVEIISNEGEEGLIRIRSTKVPQNGKDPILFGAPRSGHDSTLISNPIQDALNQGEDVWVNLLKDAEEELLPDGPYGREAQAELKYDMVKKVSEITGKRARIRTICEGGMSMIYAVAKLCKDAKNDPKALKYKPRSFFFASGPADTSVTESVVNKVGKLIGDTDINYHATDIIPHHLPNGGQAVRRSSKQISNFESSQLERHMGDLTTMANNIIRYGLPWVMEEPPSQAQLREMLANDDLEGAQRVHLSNMLKRIIYKTGASFKRSTFRASVQDNFRSNLPANGKVSVYGDEVDAEDIDCPVLTADATEDPISSIGNSMGIHPHTNAEVKSALIVKGMAHFWWGGTRAIPYFRQIDEWEADPANSNIPRFKMSMLDDAKKVHAANMAAADAKLMESDDLQWVAEYDGVEYPLTPAMRVPILAAA